MVLQHASRMAAAGKDDVFLLIREEVDDTWFEPLIDKCVGPRVMEELLFGARAPQESLLTRVVRKLKKSRSQI